jgi:hypothetical protein
MGASVSSSSHASSRPWIVIVSHVVPATIHAGDERRLVRLLQHLKRKGFRTALAVRVLRLSPDEKAVLSKLVDRVYLVREFLSLGERTRWLMYRTMSGIAWRVGLSRLIQPHPIAQFVTPFGGDDAATAQRMKEWLCPPVLVRCARAICDELQPVAVFVEYMFASSCLANLSGAPLKIIDSLDVFSRIPETVHSHGLSDPMACTEEEERRYLLNADVVMAIQPEEARILKRIVPEKVVITTGVDFDVAFAPCPAGWSADHVMIVGSDNRRNAHGLEQFLAHAWPTIRDAVPSVSLRVCGGVGRHVPSGVPGVCVVGHVPDLGVEYALAAVVVSPVVAGTGLKIKIAEALSYGKAVAATTHGVEGLLPPEESPPCAAAATWAELACEVIRLLTSESARREAETRAICYAKKYLSAECVYQELDAVMAKCATGVSPSNNPNGMESGSALRL